MNQRFDPPMRATATETWQPMYTDPIDVVEGESLTLGQTDPEWPGWQWCTDPRGKSGWVPIASINELPGQAGTIACNYTARELSLTPGEEVFLCRLESGWYWARNTSGNEGWIPGTHVSI